MSDRLASLARALSHHWKRSLLAAVASLVVLGALTAAAGSPPPDDFDIPGTESQQAYNLFSKHMPGLAGVDSTVVFYAADGRLATPQRIARIKRATAAIGRQPDVVSVSDPFATKPPLVSPDGRVTSVDVRWDLKPGDIDATTFQRLERAANIASGDGVQVSMRGMVVDAGTQQEMPVGELIGIAIAIVLLTLLFRSGAAMAATLLGALVGVLAGQLVISILAAPLGLPDFARTIAVMLGLGAGIDYALLIIGRFREQSARGDSTRDAAAKSAATAGSAVLAAGVIVIIAIAGLLVIGIPLVGKMGVGAALGVAAVVVSALTFIPIMIGALSRRLKPKRAAHVRPSKAFGAWGERITARPWLSITIGVLVLLLFTAPVTRIRLGQPDDGNQPESRTQRIAYDHLSQGFGPGSNGPFLLAVKLPEDSAASQAQLERLAGALQQTENVAAVMPPTVSEDGALASIVLIPGTSPQDAATSKLLQRLRTSVIPEAVAGTPLKVFVGGNTASFEDFSGKVADRLPVFIAFVIGLSVLLLMAAFRSIWIPLVSALFNLLSVGAAYGVVVAVFQDGIGAGLIGSDSGVPIVSFIPLMLFAILFGLSMDYNVFLLSRIHEAYNEGDPPRESVIHGMARIGKVVLFAGLIMASVFLAFVTQPDLVAKMMGMGMGLAILIDVLFVRLIIAPAVVTLLGDRAWWLPGWLDRILPRVSLEGHLVESRDPPETALVGADGQALAES